MATAYKKWLCETRGWVTNTEPCKKCHGSGEVMPTPPRYSQQKWKRDRKIAGLPPYYTSDEKVPCVNCEGGKVTLSKPVLDLARAEEYIDAQRRQLDAIARDAVAGIEARLRAAGFRPVIYGYGRAVPQTLADYDAYEAEEAAIRAEFDATWDAARESRDKFEADYAAMTPEEQVEFINRDDRVLPYRELERQGEELRQKLWRYHTMHGYFYMPGDRSRIIYAGTHNARNLQDRPKIAVSLVIKPGRAPDAAELDTLVSGAIVEAFADNELLAA